MRYLPPIALTALPACGAGVVTSDDVSGGEAIVIGVVIVCALLFVAAVGRRKR